MKNNRTILIFILSIIITILAIFLFVFFFKVIENKNIHISVVTTTLGERLKEKEESIIFAEKVSEMDLLKKSIDSHFIDHNKIDTFVNTLEDMGSTVGSDLAVKGIEVLPNDKNIVAFKISINGNFQEVMKTVTLLENSQYQINITQAYLNKSPNKIVQVTQGEKTEEKVVNSSEWQADISLNVLTIN